MFQRISTYILSKYRGRHVSYVRRLLNLDEEDRKAWSDPTERYERDERNERDESSEEKEEEVKEVKKEKEANESYED